VIRRLRPSAATIALLAGASVLCLIGPAPTAIAQRSQAPAAGHADGLQIHLTGAALAAAASRCAQWATDAGFSNDGYLAGGLTTAVAVALAESGCSAAACFDDTRNQACTRGTERAADSVDRGAWQENSKAWREITNACAFSGPCAAAAAYSLVSAVGTFFAPWTEYRTDVYARYLWPAQQAISDLRRGTVTSALAGSCLGYPSDSAGVAARLENCGSGAGQTWLLAGSELRTPAGLCLAATSRARAAVVRLARCTGGRLQQWQATGRHALYNPGARRCLSDPSGGDVPGLLLTAAACAGSRVQTWFRP
jgi:Ricin-type beta-trefoil lectin domain/Lysozyme like domain